MKTIIITSVSTFIRQRSASQSFPLAAWLNGALVGSTCHMGGSTGGGWGGGGVVVWWGRKESCSSKLTFLQHPSPTPFPTSRFSPTWSAREQGSHWDVCTLSCLTLLRIVPKCSFFFFSFHFFFFGSQPFPPFKSFTQLVSPMSKARFDSGNSSWSEENIYRCYTWLY